MYIAFQYSSVHDQFLNIQHTSSKNLHYININNKKKKLGTNFFSKMCDVLKIEETMDGTIFKRKYHFYSPI